MSNSRAHLRNQKQLFYELLNNEQEFSYHPKVNTINIEFDYKILYL